MSKSDGGDLIVPTNLPFEDLKGRDLEECLYWLLDDMGAKNLDWRLGGTGGGAADGGRDLEATFNIPSPDGEMRPERWWIEAKGRKGTVEPSVVRDSVHRATGTGGVDCLVIATNTTFSNPTRDWVQDWQRTHPRPIVRLWDRNSLERLLSKNPSAVARIFSQALSLAGKLAFARNSFWDYTRFPDRTVLAEVWGQRESISWDPRTLLAIVAGECVIGDLSARPWLAVVSESDVANTLATGLANSIALILRADRNGSGQDVIFRTFAYLFLMALRRLGAAEVRRIMAFGLTAKDDAPYPESLSTALLEPMLGTLRTELRDVCTSDCRRVSTKPILLNKHEIEHYWHRLTGADDKNPEDGVLVLESYADPCKVGLPLSKTKLCPLVHDAPLADVPTFLWELEQIIVSRTRDSR